MSKQASFEGYQPVRRLYDAEWSEVWEVVCVDDQRRRAMKFLKTGAPPELHDALAREAQLHGRIRHPSVVRRVDVAETGAGEIALVTELVDGTSLADLLDRKGPPALEVALPLFEEVVRAVRAAHAQGVVHRDLKPENIMIRLVDGGLQPVLIDFGLAKEMATDGVSRVRPGLSQWYRTLGTPEYMAPEQASNAEHADERADLFSLGCLLYELLTGKVAFDAEDPDEAIRAVRAGDYVPPEQRVRLPRGVAQLVNELLDPDPAKRPPHCTAVLRRLDGSHLRS